VIKENHRRHPQQSQRFIFTIFSQPSPDPVKPDLVLHHGLKQKETLRGKIP
jgi:hypothetical protein